jgi:hypothetical protein
LKEEGNCLDQVLQLHQLQTPGLDHVRQERQGGETAE